MFYYIDQPSTPSLPDGLVKTESESLDQLRPTHREMNTGGSCD